MDAENRRRVAKRLECGVDSAVDPPDLQFFSSVGVDKESPCKLAGGQRSRATESALAGVESYRQARCLAQDPDLCLEIRAGRPPHWKPGSCCGPWHWPLSLLLDLYRDPLHAFQDCRDATEALFQANIVPALASSSVTETLPWLEEAASLLSRPALGQFVTLLWNLWNHRNNWVHNQQLQPVWATVMTASLLHQDHLVASSSSASSSALHPTGWSPPPSGTVTLNMDGSFSVGGGAGIGVVARDSSGQVLCGLARHLDDLTEAEFAEHAALVAGLRFALDRGWTSVLVEMDSAQTVNRLSRSPSSDLSIFSPSLEPARAILSEHSHIRLRYIPRSANRVAHTLAAWALSCTSYVSFDSVCPEIIWILLSLNPNIF
ncbi:hypothetical protein V6N11_022730 [Hibiscus sabdariffa]|uniref:RNase H type-1 domain-containing protein n=1 Tax=Hibiscus sabdariffa TaxID=183260 RepID=A0ABR2TK24_9ROSI